MMWNRDFLSDQTQLQEDLKALGRAVPLLLVELTDCVELRCLQTAVLTQQVTAIVVPDVNRSTFEATRSQN